MYNPIEEKRRFVQAQIQKSFDSGINVAEEMELEKAHKDGDHHPTKPWVWVSSANGGKGDWRVEGGRAHKKAGASTTDAAAGSKVDITKIPDAEFKRITQMLEKKNPDHRDAERYLEQEEMSDAELKNFYAVAEHFKNSSKINKLTQEHCRKWAELARQEMQYRKKANSASSNTTNKGVKAPFQVLKPEVWKLAQQYNSATGSMKSKLKTTIDSMTNGDAWTHGDYTAYFYDDDIDEYVAVTREDWSNNIPPRKPGSTDEIERMTAQGVRSSILGLNNIATNVKDKGDHLLIQFDHNDFNTNGKRSPQIDRIAKFLESMGASCVIGKNEIKAYKKVVAKKDSTTKKRYNLNPDGTPMDMSKIEDDNLRFSISLVKTNIKNLKNKLGQTSNGAVVTRKNLNAKIEDQEGKLAEMEEEMNKRVNSKSTTKNQTSTSDPSNDGNSIDSVWDDKAGGYKTEPFKGAAKVDSLKAGDKLQTRNGKIYTVKSVNNNANNTVDVVMDNGSIMGGGVFVQNYNKSGYIGATKVDDNKNTTSKTQSPQGKVKDIMQQFDDTTMNEDEFDEYVNSVLGNDMGQKLRKQILESNKSFSDKRQAYKDAVEKHLGLKSQKYSDMDIKDAKEALVGKVITLKDYWPDGRGGSQDAIGEIKNVRLYGKDKLPIAEISYPNGDEQLIRLDEIDDGKMKDSYNTPITVSGEKTRLNAIKKKIANINSDSRNKIAHDAGFKDYEEMKGYQDYVTMKNLLKKKSTSAGMRLLYQQEIAKYEKDHADIIKRIGGKK